MIGYSDLRHSMESIFVWFIPLLFNVFLIIVGSAFIYIKGKK